jgi:hypothetical protein
MPTIKTSRSPLRVKSESAVTLKIESAMAGQQTPYHTPVLRNRTEASIRAPRMFKSHAWQQYDKQMKCNK